MPGEQMQRNLSPQQSDVCKQARCPFLNYDAGDPYCAAVEPIQQGRPVPRYRIPLNCPKKLHKQ